MVNFTGRHDLMATLHAHGGRMDPYGYWWFSMFKYLPEDKPRVKAIMRTIGADFDLPSAGGAS